MGSVKADDAYVPHGNGERDEAYSFHVCACFNGTTAGGVSSGPLHPAAENERAAVVRWLRTMPDMRCTVIDAIARGAHHHEEENGCPYCGALGEPNGCADCAAEAYERGTELCEEET
jgi:hypothetical protein